MSLFQNIHFQNDNTEEEEKTATRSNVQTNLPNAQENLQSQNNPVFFQ